MAAFLIGRVLLIVLSWVFGAVAVVTDPVDDLVGSVDLTCPLVEPADHRVLGWWTFDRPGGSACDASGRGNHGLVLGNPVFQEGRFGGALRFDGHEDEVRVPDSPTLDEAAVTVMAWIQPGAASAEEAFLSRNTYSNVEGWGAWFDHGANPVARAPAVHYSRPGVNVLATTGAALPDVAWTHVAFTYDGAAFVVYANGAPAGRQPWLGGIQASFDDALRIGTTNGGAFDGNPFFHGVIDEVKLYGRVLQAHEIACEAEANTPLC